MISLSDIQRRERDQAKTVKTVLGILRMEAKRWKRGGLAHAAVDNCIVRVRNEFREAR